MKNKKLTIVNAGVAFVISFILSQFTLAIGTSITKTIMSALGRSSAQIDAFFATSVGYLLKSIYLNIAFIAVFAWYFKSIGKHNLVQKPNKPTLKYATLCIGFGVLSFFLLSGVLNHFQWFVTKIGYKVDPDPFELNSIKDLLVCYVSLAIIPAVCEELLFRGVIINCLKHKGEIFAIVLSAIMFAIFHFSPLQLIYPICWGLLLGIVYLRTKNIIFPIIMHFINNAFSLTLQYFVTSSGTFSPSVSMAIYSIVTFAIWLFIIVYLFKDFIRHNKVKLDNTQFSNNNDNFDDIATSQDSIQTQTNTSDSDQESVTYGNTIFYGAIALMLCIYILLLFA